MLVWRPLWTAGTCSVAVLGPQLNPAESPATLQSQLHPTAAKTLEPTRVVEEHDRKVAKCLLILLDLEFSYRCGRAMHVGGGSKYVSL